VKRCFGNLVEQGIDPKLEFIKLTLPWAHGHQLKAITTFVAAILEKQTGCQAQLARALGNQEAARPSALPTDPQ
jgi:hypothetical protein